MTENMPLKRVAFQFIVLLGIVSLFADMTYEGARSVTGPYLLLLGANAAIVGTVAGLGELVGYSIRFISGYLSDKTKKYWFITILGYIINLLAVPLMALAGNWQMASALIVMERLGKAIRNPARDAILSYATKEVGRGLGFGLHKALDQIGAILGPLIVATVLYFNGSYRMSFAILLIPALLALGVLALARIRFPQPQDLEVRHHDLKTKGFNRLYWFYVAAISLVALGYVDYPLIAYHFENSQLMDPIWIPILYAIAMGVDGISALIFGRLFDQKGLIVLIMTTTLAAFFAPFVFLGGFWAAIIGTALWGIGLGVQESIMRAVVAELVDVDRRGSAYGVLNMSFGIFWFLGSALMGFLYDISLTYIVAFSLIVQLASIPLFMIVRRMREAK